MGSSFWADYTVDVKRNYRWVLNIGGLPHWIARTTQKPSFEMTETELPYLNHTFFYPGRLKWNPIEFSLVDPLQPDASKTIMNIVEAGGYHFPEDPNDLSTLSKASSVNALGRVVIAQIGSSGDIVEEWELKNAWLKNVNFADGELSYDNDDVTILSLEVRFDYAVMSKAGTPVPIN